jgi:hypothetical protein
MTSPAKSRAKVSSAAKGKQTYRGIVLQKPAVRSRFTVAQIERAIKNAIAKNPHVFAGRR